MKVQPSEPSDLSREGLPKPSSPPSDGILVKGSVGSALQCLYKGLRGISFRESLREIDGVMLKREPRHPSDD